MEKNGNKSNFIIAKTLKGKEFMYSNNYSILCGSKKECEILARHLNNNNDSAINDFKLKDNEIWYVYEIDNYSSTPKYKLINTKGKISVVYND